MRDRTISGGADTLPGISVVTPSFNQVAYLDRAIRSVLDQDYPKVELLVCDGGSTDGSVDVIRRHEAGLSYWRSAPDEGQAAAVNEGWGRSKGEVLGWLNSDDYYLPGALRFVGTYFAEHPEVAFLYGACLVVGPDGMKRGDSIGRTFDRRSMLLGHQPMAQPATFLRRSLWGRVGPLDQSLEYAMDFDYFLRAAEVSHPVFTDVPLAAFTVHRSAKSSRGRAASRAETFAVALRHAPKEMAPAIRLRATMARLYHSLPAAVRGPLDRLRPTVLDI